MEESPAELAEGGLLDFLGATETQTKESMIHVKGTAEMEEFLRNLAKEWTVKICQIQEV